MKQFAYGIGRPAGFICRNWVPIDSSIIWVKYAI